MGKKEKLYSKAINSPNNISFDDVCSLAEYAGCVFKRYSGDHKIYEGPDGRIMNFQPVNGKAKPYQVRQLISYIDENDLIKED